VRAVRALLDRAGNDAPVEIDGGIDHSNVGRVVAAGARIIVAGSAVFHSGDPERATRELKAAAMSAFSAL
jgi:ribulose-phosphate 3-epimerase